MFKTESIVSVCLLVIKMMIIGGILWLTLVCDHSGFNGGGN